MSVLNNYPIKRMIHRTKKYNLQFYFPPVSVYDLNKIYNINSTGILYLALPYQTGIASEMLKYRSFKITIANFKDVLRTIERAIKWFGGETYRDMYIETEDGILLLNADYKQLYSTTDRSYFEDQLLKITPCVLEVANNKYTPGVYLFINLLENRIDLSINELVRLYDILSDFNFTNEMILCLELLKHSINTSSYMNEDEYRKRMGFNKGEL